MADEIDQDELKTPVRVETREGFSIWIEFEDGVQGVADVSNFARQPAFAGWRDRACFERVHLDSNDYLVWDCDQSNHETRIDPDELYSRLTGLSFEEMYPKWAAAAAARGPGFPDPVLVEPRDGLTIWLKYSDGSSGIVDLSNRADGPAFAGWNDRAYFESVHISDYGTIQWGDDLEQCSDALYLELTGKNVAEVLPILKAVLADA